jgi:hypothetical protein
VLAVRTFEVAEQEIALKPVNQNHYDAKHRDNQGFNSKCDKASEVKHNGFVGIGQVQDHYNYDDCEYGIDQRLKPAELSAFAL